MASKNRLFWILCASFVLWTAVLFFAIGPRHTSKSLRGWGSDHYSHYAETVLVFHKGFQIYTKPIAELCDRFTENGCELNARKGKPPLVINWGNLPRPYPLGIYLLHLPQALALEAGVDDGILRYSIILVYLLITHLFFYISFRDLIHVSRSSGMNALVRWIVLPIIYLEGIRWSLAGFYDAVVVLFIWLSLRAQLWEKQPAQSFMYFALALSFGYRALWFIPVSLLALRELKSAVKTSRTNQSKIAISCVLIAISLFGFYLYWPSLDKHPHTNPVHWRALWGDDSRPMAFLAPLAILFFYLIRERLWIPLSFIGTQTFVSLTLIQPQRWHGLSLVPLFLVPFALSRKSVRTLVAVLFFFLITNHHVFKHNPLSGIVFSEVIKDFRKIHGADVIRDYQQEQK